MTRKRKVCITLAAITGLVGLLLIAAYYQLFLRPLPQTHGRISLPGLKDTVEIYRDSFGVPHIFASNEEDLFFAQGYVAAQDRLWQMDLNRRIAAGKLSEIFGAETLEADKFLRTLGIGRIGEELAENTSPEASSVLESYAKGVNCFIFQNRKRLPVEFRILQYQPEPWEPSHSLAYLRLLGWMLSFAWETETALLRLTETVSDEKAREAFPSYPSDVPLVICRLGDFSPAPFNQPPLGNWLSSGGSNSWVVSGDWSTRGKPMLANDPHLRLVVPSPWHEVHLRGGQYDVMGFSFPGLPLVAIGRNRAVAWGLTNLMADDLDFYTEKLNPEDPEQYRFVGKWEEMAWRIEEIEVRGRGKETIEVRSTRHGPIVSEFIKDGREAISVRWTGFERTSEADAFIRINKARNWEDFKEGLRQFGTPPQNFVYADTAGNIGCWSAGAIPIRRPGQGLLAVPGWTGENEWKGFIPLDELPHLFNPEKGFIATANNKVVGEGYPYYISSFWEPPWRALRIEELLAQKTQFSLDDFRQMQLDRLSTQARENVPRILQALQGKPLSEMAELAVELLSSWDFILSPQSSAASVHEVLYSTLMKNTFRDEMGSELYEDYTVLPNLPMKVLDRMIRKGDSAWFDDIGTAQEENFGEILHRSLEETVLFLSNRLGEDPLRWEWGALHRIRFDHPLGKPRPLQRLLNIAPAPVGGSFATLNLGGYAIGDPSLCVFAPTARYVVDLADPHSSLSVVPPGQSGHPRSYHYRDQVAPWLNGEYHPAYLDQQRIVASAPRKLLLIPKRTQ